jgi:lipase chaperone LimK
MIIGDQSLFGKEKEKRLQKLKVDMWSDAEEMPPDDPNPYNRYQIRLQLYYKDLTGLDEGARRTKIKEFRKDFFSGEQMKKLAAVDDRIAEEQEMMKHYRMAEREILLKKYITQAEKNKRITALQDEFFGRDAEAFRRREAMSANVGK